MSRTASPSSSSSPARSVMKGLQVAVVVFLIATVAFGCFAQVW